MGGRIIAQVCRLERAAHRLFQFLASRTAPRAFPDAEAGLRATGRSASVGRVKIVYRAENIIDANLVKAALAEAGIQAFVSGEYLTGAIGQLPAWDLVTVMVAEADVERAAPIAESIDAALRERRAIAPSGAAMPQPT